VAPGDPVAPLGRPLAARLGPGLLGGVFDGLLRPLYGGAVWLAPGALAAEADERTWSFTPCADVGSTVGPGEPLGSVAGAGSITHRVLVPPGIAGRVERLADPGGYRGDQVIASVGGTSVTLAQWWPAGLASALAAFYERAGRVTTLGGRDGSVTIIGAVLPPGGDMTEPVTAHTQRFVRTPWTLDRDLAYARHYPAVGWAGSYCRDAAATGAWYARSGDDRWAARRGRVVSTLAEADRLAAALAELVGAAALPGNERVMMLAGRLLREGVLQQRALSPRDAYCAPEKSAALIEMVFDVVSRCDELIEAGIPATAIEQCDFTPVLRAREETDPADAKAVRVCRETMLRALEELR
jgi:vacuolar-type H+-ATPase catalytic subunit A/Vma1